MKTFVAKIKTAEIPTLGEGEAFEIGLEGIFGGTVASIASVTTTRLDDVYTLITFTGTTA